MKTTLSNQEKELIKNIKIKRIQDKNLYKQISSELNITTGSLYNFLSGQYHLSEEKFNKLKHLIME